VSAGVRIALIGMGKMGRALAELAPERGLQVAATLGRGTPVTADSLRGAAVALEFTEPAAAPANLRACAAAGCPVVVGTTGWYEQLPTIAVEFERAGTALLWAANFSLGVNLFLRIAAESAPALVAGGFDSHLVETYHARKKDAPSGTALAIADAVADAGAPRPAITSVRTGHVPGTHELIFDGPFEQVRLVHAARDRRAFADGALAAARWLVGRRGVFTMADVLAFPDGAR
jgi:4-hydroxy-tetrahydrodipicolinate reductase